MSGRDDQATIAEKESNVAVGGGISDVGNLEVDRLAWATLFALTEAQLSSSSRFGAHLSLSKVGVLSRELVADLFVTNNKYK